MHRLRQMDSNTDGLELDQLGFQDTASMSKKLREGYEVVRAEELTSQIGKNDYSCYQRRKTSGGSSELEALCWQGYLKIVEQRSAYFKKRSSEQIQAVDNDLMKEQRPEMPINISRHISCNFWWWKKKIIPF